MADPGTTTNTPPASSSGDPSILSDLGSLGSSALQFVGSPAGGQVIAGGVDMYEAGKANRQVAGLYQPVQQTGGAFTQAGTQTLGKTQPALTASIPGQTGFATQQQGVAAKYGTGNLTPEQQQQIETYRQQQKSRAMAELANAGINDPNSSQMQTKMQEIDDNAMSMAQNLVEGNQQIATGAQANVMNIYNTLLKQALASAGLGTDAQLAAAHGIIQGDQQVGNALQTLLKGISGIVTTGQPTAGQPGQPGGVAAGQAGGGTNVAAGALSKGAGALGDIGYKLGVLGPGYSAADTSNVANLGTRAQASSTDIQNQATAGLVQPDLSGIGSSFDPNALSFDSAPSDSPTIAMAGDGW